MDGKLGTEDDLNGMERESRLHNQSEFSLVRSNGHSSAGKYCVVNVLFAPPDGNRKAAFSISRRFSKLAVERNRARRLFREVYRIIYGKIPVSWIIFIPRQHIKHAKMADVLEDVIENLRRLGIGNI